MWTQHRQHIPAVLSSGTIFVVIAIAACPVLASYAVQVHPLHSCQQLRLKSRAQIKEPKQPEAGLDLAMTTQANPGSYR